MGEVEVAETVVVLKIRSELKLVPKLSIVSLLDDSILKIEQSLDVS